ncbi:MAG: hypothetical protein C0500_04795 [Sphingobium sp.]|nr:hypothetical protein [Sphingobium sp.]
MAAHAPITPARPRASFTPVPPTAVTRLLARFDRATLAGFIEVAIDLLDMADPNPDDEPDGDELDGDPRAEDEFVWHGHDGGAGCPLDAEVDDEDYCEARDDGCGPHLLHGRTVWGSEHDA